PLAVTRRARPWLEHEPAPGIAARQVIGAQAAHRGPDLERRGVRRLRPAHGLAEARDHGEAGQHPEAEEEREADRDQDRYALSHWPTGMRFWMSAARAEDLSSGAGVASLYGPSRRVPRPPRPGQLPVDHRAVAGSD